MTLGLVKALAARGGGGPPLVHLLGHPRVTCDDDDVRLADSGMRLLALVSLAEGAVDRRLAAAALWPDVDDVHAAANLRTALWRVNGAGRRLVDATRASLHLTDRVQVDARLLADWAGRVITHSTRHDDFSHAAWDVDRLELLPGWSDDWVILERERLRQRLLHAMEEMCRVLVERGRCAEAIDVALVTVEADPLRESAQEVLIAAHLAEGNRAQAWRAFEQHREVLWRELGVEPDPGLVRLLAGVRRVPARSGRRPAVQRPLAGAAPSATGR